MENHFVTNKMILLLLYLIFPSYQHEYIKEDCIRDYHLPKSLSIDWKSDSLGCDNLRVKYYSIFEEKQVKGMGKSCLINVFGTPNYYFISDCQEDFVYLVGGRCENDEYSDFAEFWINVKSDTVYDIRIEID